MNRRPFVQSEGPVPAHNPLEPTRCGLNVRAGARRCDSPASGVEPVGPTAGPDCAGTDHPGRTSAPPIPELPDPPSTHPSQRKNGLIRPSAANPRRSGPNFRPSAPIRRPSGLHPRPEAPQHLQNAPRHLANVPQHLAHAPRHLAKASRHLAHVPQRVAHDPVFCGERAARAQNISSPRAGEP